MGVYLCGRSLQFGPDEVALLRLDRKRKKKTSNENWKSPADPEAEITKLKDGRTALAYKVEQAVDMETGAIVAVTTHGGAAADSATVAETLCEAGEAVAELINVKNPEGNYPVADGGIAEVVADKGYHSNQTMVEIKQLGLRTYVAEPDRGARNWSGKAEERDAVYANRRRINGERGKRLQSQRGEKIERNFAHQFDTGGMDRLYLRGRENVHKKMLIQPAACNLALLLRPCTEPESRERPTISSRQPFLLFCGSRLPYSERDSLTWPVHRYRVRIP